MKKKLEILIDFLKYQSGKEYKKDKFGLIHPPDEKVIDMEMGVPIICSDCYEELSVREKEDYEYRNEAQLIIK